MAGGMTVRWHDDALGAYEFLRGEEGFEEVFEAAAVRVRRLEADPSSHRVDAQQRRTSEGMVWFVALGPRHERWMMWWNSPEPGVVMIRGLERLEGLLDLKT